ncbi:hypothetical protein MKSMC1_29820 [Mycobacterium kansasii]|nr:hypothetical protein MKSMC1_29820 [Mycobacterium kansasii]
MWHRVIRRVRTLHRWNWNDVPRLTTAAAMTDGVPPPPVLSP